MSCPCKHQPPENGARHHPTTHHTPAVPAAAAAGKKKKKKTLLLFYEQPHTHTTTTHLAYCLCAVVRLRVAPVGWGGARHQDQQQQDTSPRLCVCAHTLRRHPLVIQAHHQLLLLRHVNIVPLANFELVDTQEAGVQYPHLFVFLQHPDSSVLVLFFFSYTYISLLSCLARTESC